MNNRQVYYNFANGPISDFVYGKRLNAYRAAKIKNNMENIYTNNPTTLRMIRAKNTFNQVMNATGNPLLAAAMSKGAYSDPSSGKLSMGEKAWRKIKHTGRLARAAITGNYEGYDPKAGQTYKNVVGQVAGLTKGIKDTAKGALVGPTGEGGALKVVTTGIQNKASDVSNKYLENLNKKVNKWNQNYSRPPCRKLIIKL